MLLRQIGVTAMAGGFARVLTFVIPFVVARIFGIGVVTDAFFLAAAIVLFWTVSIAAVVETSVVTRTVGQPAADGRRAAISIGLRFTAIAVVLAALVMATTAFVPASFVAPTLLGEARQVFLVLSPLLVLGVWSCVLGGWLNARRRFGRAALSPVFVGIAVLASMFTLSDSYGIYAVAGGYVAGEAARLGYLLLVCWRARPEDAGDRPSGPAIAVGGMGLQWGSFVLIAFNPVVDRIFASGLAPGSISALELIDRVFLLPGGILSWAVLPVLVTHWAGLRDQQSRLRRQLIVAVGGAVLAGTAVALALWPSHGLLFAALFDPASGGWPEAGSRAMAWLLPGLPFQLAALVLWRANVVLQRPPMTLFAISGLAFGVNLVGDALLAEPMGLPGITMVTAVTMLIYAAMLWRSCRIRV